MRIKTSLSAEVIRRLGRPLTPEEARLLILAETILEEEEVQPEGGGEAHRFAAKPRRH